MKILLGMLDIANQARTTVKELNRLGHKAHFFDGQQNYLKYQDDTEAEAFRLREAPNLNDFDVFDIFFASFMGDSNGNSNIPDGCKCVHHFCGSEVRQLSVSQQTNSHISVVKDTDEKRIKERLYKLSEFTDTCTIKDHELYDHISPYFKQIYEIPRMIDLSGEYSEPTWRERKGQKPVVVHAPTDPAVKGTQFVVDAVKTVQTERDFDFYLASGLSHQQAVSLYRQADIIIDQLHIGTYGQLAIEGMAMGAIVVSYISDYMREYLPKDLPLVSPKQPSDIGDTIRGLFGMRDSWPEISKQMRSYVENHHDSKKVINQLVEVYERL